MQEQKTKGRSKSSTKDEAVMAKRRRRAWADWFEKGSEKFWSERPKTGRLLDMEAHTQFADEQLEALINWVSQVPQFAELPRCDQVQLLRTGTAYQHCGIHGIGIIDIFVLL